MEILMFSVVLFLLWIDSIYRANKRVARNSSELMYKYQMLGQRRRFKSMRGVEIFIKDNL